MELISKSKTTQLEEWLLETISDQDLKSGDKILSENHLTRKFNISRITVRRALKKLEEKGIVRRRRGQGTFIESPALIKQHFPRLVEEGAAKKSNNISRIGFLTFFPSKSLLSPNTPHNSFTNVTSHSMIMSAATRKVAEMGAALELRNIEERDSVESLCEVLLDFGYDGMILSKPLPSLVTDAVTMTGIPSVIYTGDHQNSKLNYVMADNESGAAEMTRYLIDKGHTKIVFALTGFENSVFWQRYSYCRRSMLMAGLDEPETFFDFTSPEAVEKMLNEKQPTAIFAANDAVAMELIMSLSKLGLTVPDDVSMVGFDNDPNYISLFPELTTIEAPWDDIGECAVELLAECYRDKSRKARKIIFPPRLVERTSVKDLTGIN